MVGGLLERAATVRNRWQMRRRWNRHQTGQTPPVGGGSSLVWSQEVATLQNGQWPESFRVMEHSAWAWGKPSRCLAGSTKLMRGTCWPHIMSGNFQTKTTSEKFEGAQLVGTKVLLSIEWLPRLNPNWTS